MLQPGRRSTALRVAEASGLCARAVDPEPVQRCLEGEPLPPGWSLRRYAWSWRDGLRSRQARAGWFAAFAVDAARLPGPEPLAFVEGPWLGGDRGSALLLRDPADPSAAAEAPLGERLQAWARLWGRLHEAGFRTPPPDLAALDFAEHRGQLVARLRAPDALRLSRWSARRTERRALDRLEATWRRLGADADLCRRGRVAYARSRLWTPRDPSAPNASGSSPSGSSSTSP